MRSGLSLIEIVVVMILLGTALIPVVQMQLRHKRQEHTAARALMADSLVRDAAAYLFRQRDAADPAGFRWLWTQAARPAVHSGWGVPSGVSAPGGDPVNPPLDGQYRHGNAASPAEGFDRFVRLRRVTRTVPRPAGTVSVIVIEVTVTVFHEDGDLLALPGPGQPAYYQVVTYIGNGGPAAVLEP